MPLTGVIRKRVVLQSRNGDHLKSSRLHHPVPTDVRCTYPATAPRQSRHSPAKVQQKSRDSTATVPRQTRASPATVLRKFSERLSDSPVKVPPQSRQTPAKVPRASRDCSATFPRQSHDNPVTPAEVPRQSRGIPSQRAPDIIETPFEASPCPRFYREHHSSASTFSSGDSLKWYIRDPSTTLSLR